MVAKIINFNYNRALLLSKQNASNLQLPDRTAVIHTCGRIGHAASTGQGKSALKQTRPESGAHIQFTQIVFPDVTSTIRPRFAPVIWR